VRSLTARRLQIVALAGLLAACSVETPAPGSPAASEPGPASVSPGASVSASEPPAPVAHRIGVRVVDGDGEFYDRLTGERFVPRGGNLIRLDDYHVTLDPQRYNSADIERQLTRMAELGFNVVRIFNDQRSGRGLGAGGGPGLSGAYMDNATDLLARARAHGIYVMFTQDWLPELGRYAVPPVAGIGGVNAAYLSRGGVGANARFFGDFVDALIARGAALDAVWAFELRNELYFDATRPPFSLASGSVTAANGQTYDMADPAERRAILEDGVVYWTDAVRAEILRHDPTALVTVGFFVPQGPNLTRPGDSRIIETREEIARSAADFIDLHGYPRADLPLAQHLENFGLTGPAAKPIVMGEMGGFRNLFPSAAEAARALVSWEAASCAYGFDGWLVWTWDSVDYRETWNMTDADGAIAEALAPVNRPDPCSDAGGEPVNLAAGATVTASSQIETGPASAAVDGSAGNIWNSGAGAPGWIQIDLGAPAPPGSEVRLVVAQSPAGETEHRVYGGPSPDALIRLYTFSGSTADAQILSFTLDAAGPAVRYLRIETPASPSWVAWREIEVIPPS